MKLFAAIAALVASAPTDSVDPKNAGCASGEPTLSKTDLPIVRLSPLFPSECIEGMAEREELKLRLTVRPDGSVQRAEVVETSNACFNDAAVKNALRNRYCALADPSQGIRVIKETMFFEIVE